MTTRLNVLVVEDSQDDADLLVAELRRAQFDPKWTRVETEADFIAEIQKKPDIVLSDFAMPQFNGLRAADILQASGLNIPFILISGTVGEEIAVEAMQHGAMDYLLKDRIARLGVAVRRALKEAAERAERKKLEAQFIEAQKMEVIGHLAGGVAHDFNNVLAVILGYSELLLESAPPHPMRELIEEVRLAAERAKGLTNQLLVFSRRQTVQLVVLDLNQVVTDMEKMLRRLIGETVELTSKLGTRLGRVRADSGYIGQILMNLVVNARDAMPNGGELTIETSNVTATPQGAETETGLPRGHYVRLAVSDTGVGITDEVKRRLFEAFFTTKPKGQGTGLGLATCQTIVKQCGGCIEVSSEVGKGTSFKIYFPCVDEPLDGTAFLAKIRPLPCGTETILVVEDEPSLRHLASTVLQAQGYTVLSANSGQDGLRVAREHKGPPIRLVISDVIMPQMSGNVMAEWLKATYPDLRILFTSGYTDAAIVQHGVLDPGVSFLAKPYTPSTLASKVREVLDAPVRTQL
jgi:two-component system cell cycle sensor histidine kinase/response regulator CckA